MNIQDDGPLATEHPEDHRSVLNEVHTLKEYSINLNTLSRKIYNQIKGMTSTIQEYSIDMDLWLEITDDRNSIERATVTVGIV